VAWIESNQEVGRHPKTKKLAKLLDISVVTAVGHLHYLWWWALDYAEEGTIGKFDESDIAEAVMWAGNHHSFVEALVQAGFVDRTESDLLIHDWFEYAGRLLVQKQMKREKTNERVKRFRDNKSEKTCNADEKTCNAPTVPTKPTKLTVPDPTVPKLNIINIIIPREGEHTIGTEAVDWAQKNWGRVIPKGEADAIVALCEEFSASGSEDPDTVVIEGLKYCLDADVRNVSYLRGILTDWREAGILSVDQVKAHEAEHVSQKKRKKHKALVGKQSLTPTNKYDSFYR